MLTITGKIESATGATAHAAITFTSLSTPQFQPTIIQVNTVKRVLTNASTGEFSVTLAAGNYAVNVRALGLDTNFVIAVPDGNDTVSIETLVTTTTAALPGQAPYTVWNGERAGDITFLPVANPHVPASVAVQTVPGSTMVSGDLFAYCVSYVTTTGETGLSGVADVAIALSTDQGLRVTFGELAPTRVTAIRLWRNKDTGVPAEFYLLAQLETTASHYDDWEGHADFALRASRPPPPPTYNTTAGIINSSPSVPQLYFSSTGLRVLSTIEFDAVAQFNHDFKKPAGAGAGYVFTSDANGFGNWQPPAGRAAAGSPEGAQTATPGTTYLNTTNESFWVKKTGSGNTGWIQLIGA